MRIFRDTESNQLAISLERGPWLPVSSLGDGAENDVYNVLRSMTGENGRSRWHDAYDRCIAEGSALPRLSLATTGAPYRHPRMILGIGLNYRSHAEDLDESCPSSPASFLKGDHTVIGSEDPILLPDMSKCVTAEGEVGLVIGRACHQVSEEQALDFVAGICAVLAQTADDILRENPRFLIRAKKFPTFFSFGPEIVSLDEVGGLGDLVVATHRNGSIVRMDRVRNMIFSPAELIAFHSHVVPLYPTDIISTGSPGGTVIRAGDVVECHVGDLAPLVHPVKEQHG